MKKNHDSGLEEQTVVEFPVMVERRLPLHAYEHLLFATILHLKVKHQTSKNIWINFLANLTVLFIFYSRKKIQISSWNRIAELHIVLIIFLIIRQLIRSYTLIILLIKTVSKDLHLAASLSSNLWRTKVVYGFKNKMGNLEY